MKTSGLSSPFNASLRRIGTTEGSFRSCSVSRYLTLVRSSRDTRPHGWLLYLGKPQTLYDSLPQLLETLRVACFPVGVRYCPWRLPLSHCQRLAPAVGCPNARASPVLRRAVGRSSARRKPQKRLQTFLHSSIGITNYVAVLCCFFLLSDSAQNTVNKPMTVVSTVAFG